jgi:hypothetical protein
MLVEFSIHLKSALKRHPFIYEHPECVLVLKRALEYALQGQQQKATGGPSASASGSSSTSVPQTGVAGGSGSGFITSQMLQQALAAITGKKILKN